MDSWAVRAQDWIMDHLVFFPTQIAKKTENKAVRFLCMIVQFFWAGISMAVVLPVLLSLAVWVTVADYLEDP